MNRKQRIGILLMSGVIGFVALSGVVWIKILNYVSPPPPPAVAISPLAEPAAPPAQSATAAPTAPAPAAPALSEAELTKPYVLPANTAIALLDPATISADTRLALYRKRNPAQAQRIPGGPDSMTLRWQSGKLGIMSMSFGRKTQFPWILQPMLDIYPGEIRGDESVLEIPGDVVWQAGATPDQYLSGIEQIVAQNGSAKVHLSLQSVQQDAIVFAGTWKYTPVRGEGIPARNMDSILVYNDLPYVSGFGGGGGTLRRFAGALEGRLFDSFKKPVVFEAEAGATPTQISWTFNHEDNMDDKKTLDRIHEQTGLNWSIQSRSIRYLVIEKS